MRIIKPTIPFRDAIAIEFNVGSPDRKKWLAVFTKLTYVVLAARRKKQRKLCDNHVANYVLWYLCTCRRHQQGGGEGALQCLQLNLQAGGQRFQVGDARRQLGKRVDGCGCHGRWWARLQYHTAWVPLPQPYAPRGCDQAVAESNSDEFAGDLIVTFQKDFAFFIRD
jgi:hypothetical protein